MPDDPPEMPTPEEPPRTPPWATRPARPDGGVPSEAGSDEERPRSRSIFNRFRRGRTAPEDLQTQLVFPEEESPAAEADAPPTLEPARSPWRRPTSEDSAPAVPSDTRTLPPAVPPPSRPTPPMDAALPTEVVDGPPDEVAAAPAIEPLTPRAVAPSVAATPLSAAPSVPVPPPFAAVLPPRAVEAPAVASEHAFEAETPAGMPASGDRPAASVTPPPPSVEMAPVAAPIAPVIPDPPTAWRPAPSPSIMEPSYVEHPADMPSAAEEEPGPSRGWAAFRPVPVPVNPYMLLLTGLATLVTLAYLLVEPSPRWFLILGVAVVAAGLDGTLRATWRVTYAGRETTAALFMPAIFILAVPPLIEHNVRGLGVVPAGLAAGLAFFAIVAAQAGSARPEASYYAWARTVSTAGAYAAGFAFFSLTYVYDLGLVASALAVGLVALMLAIEVLREGEIDSVETAGYAAAAGVAVAQWRIALHYLPVDGYLAGLAVLLGFLLVTGLLQAYITNSLDRRATVDHGVVALAGAALVIGARVAGLA